MELIEYTPETQADVEIATGMICREMNPEPEYLFTRCQIGFISSFDELGYPIFHLRACGRIWKEAFLALRQNQKLAETI